MPPSGYSAKDTSYIKDFLNSCASALKRERAEKNESYIEALNREIKDIARYLQTPGLDLAQVSTLKLTSAFYQKVVALEPISEEKFSQAVSNSLENISHRILAIHIEPEVLSH